MAAGPVIRADGGELEVVRLTPEGDTERVNLGKRKNPAIRAKVDQVDFTEAKDEGPEYEQLELFPCRSCSPVEETFPDLDGQPGGLGNSPKRRRTV